MQTRSATGVQQTGVVAEAQQLVVTAATAAKLEQIDKYIEIRRQTGPERNLFAMMKARPLSHAQLAVFGREFGYFIEKFPGILARLNGRVEDDSSRFFLTGILYQELGSGDEAKAHPRLFKELLLACGLSEEEISAPAQFEETLALPRWLDRLYTHGDLVEALGVQYSLEHRADGMISQVGLGFTHYNLAEKDQAYFLAHAEQEPQHEANMRALVMRHVRTPDQIEKLDTQVPNYLDLIDAVWQRRYAEIKKL